MSRTRSLFNLQARRRAVCLEIAGVDHDCLGRGTGSGQSFHHAQEQAPRAPPLPSVAEGLVRFVLPGRIAPAHYTAVYEDDAAQHPPIINPGLAVTPGKVRIEPRHLLGQPIQVAYH
jgi:hypothetical protein